MKMVSVVVKYFKALFFTIAMLAIANPVFASEATQLNSGDTAWILTSTALVLFMTLPGLALFLAAL